VADEADLHEPSAQDTLNSSKFSCYLISWEAALEECSNYGLPKGYPGLIKLSMNRSASCVPWRG